MDMIEECRKLLEGQNWSAVSRRSGLAYGTVRDLAKGNTDDIYVSTYQKIKEAVACSSDPTKQD